MTNETRIIPLTRGRVAIVDASDYAMLSAYTWHASEKGYASGTVNLDGKRVTVRMHRLLMGLLNGDPRQIDHINGDPTDNRRCNLRICTLADNNRNRKAQKTNTTGLKGVHMDKETGFFISQIQNQGKKVYLGYYKTAEEAHAAYCKAATELHGEFANHG